jgi:H/ACA ribonucleoprotein complex subunit 4
MKQDIKELINFGIINIDKPTGPTSFSVSNYTKKALEVNKTSHMGTLDPKVTGVLPITLGRACRLAGHIIAHDKTYIGILETHTEQKQEHLQELINKHFTGTIKQTPPNKSAVKRAERTRTVHYFNIKETSEDKRSFLFECKVEGGTYIRKICSDLGEMIGGAHMGELRRTAAGLFNEEKIYTLYQLEEAIKEMKEGNEEPLRNMIIPAEEIIKKIMPTTEIEKRAVKALWNGKPLFEKDVTEKEKIKQLKEEAFFAAFNKKTFIGIYKKSEEYQILGRPEFIKQPLENNTKHYIPSN